jgi:hypothetical protein
MDLRENQPCRLYWSTVVEGGDATQSALQSRNLGDNNNSSAAARHIWGGGVE